MIARTDDDRETLREGGQRLGCILHEIAKAVKPGVTLRELDALAERLIIDAGGAPAFKGYHPRHASKPYPGTLCTSVNDEVVHGIPTRDVALRNGDTIGLDIGMRWPNEGAPPGSPSGPLPSDGSLARSSVSSAYRDPSVPGLGAGKALPPLASSLAALGSGRGLYTDTAITVGVGKISKEVRRLIVTTERALEAGIAAAVVGNRVSDIARAVQAVVENAGYSVIRDLVGHGVGLKVHEDPQVPNWWDARNVDVELVEGMVIAIEPMVAAGRWPVRMLPDGWTVVTADGSLAAHFEHTVLITKERTEIITRP